MITSTFLICLAFGDVVWSGWYVIIAFFMDMMLVEGLTKIKITNKDSDD